jgi:hypothetical protein
VAPVNNLIDARRLLVERVAASRYIGRSARLRNLFLYVCERVLNDAVGQIHEQELGHAVFGRSKDYDTGADNIVRVHASLLRKRLDQYFSSEGKEEPLIIELPKGNYAPTFTPRPRVEPLPAATEEIPLVQTVQPKPIRSSKFWVAVGIAVAFALLSAGLLIRQMRNGRVESTRTSPIVRQFWSQVFPSGHQTDIVMDDAGIALYQELTGAEIRLSEYYDRNYLRHLGEKSFGAKVDGGLAASIVLKRQSSYANTSLLWKLSETASSVHGQAGIHFARDYSFRELKSNSAVLLGNTRSNPWIEPFENRLGIRWKFDSEHSVYYPVDSWGAPADRDRYRSMAEGGYASIGLVSNLSGTGSVLILSGSGGSAMITAADFLVDAASLARLQTRLPARAAEKFPYFEALLHLKARSRLPGDAAIVISRAPRS